MRRPEQLTNTERKCLDELCEHPRPWLRPTSVPGAWPRWCANAAASVWPSMSGSRTSASTDKENSAPWAPACGAPRAAVLAVLSTTLTPGAAEGNATRIKLLKRQMYGRASLDLLRRLVLLSP
ncbi:hypothetical protein ACFY3M_51375 [Streptomyces mirabilis]|uniref:hypothetical protein n=1 Tax=Streptomyces mirabilis TaxID=68239 RepID=UPI0036A815C7